MDEDHTPGKCHCCHEETQVRWKNIYHMGSEGLTVCLPCEMIIVDLVRSLSRRALKKKLDKIYKQKGS